MKTHTILKIIALIGLLLFACVTTTATPTPELAGEESLPDVSTATDTAVPPTDTSTPEPTETPSPEPTDTPVPTETATPTPDLAATTAFEATQAAEEAMALVGDTLAELELSTESGNLAWIQEEAMPIKSSTYDEFNQEGIDDGVVYENYVLYVDVTWETTTALAGCGITFHSEDNLEKGKQYQFFAYRFSGLPAWDVELWEYGRYKAQTTGKWMINEAIDLSNGATNSYVLVVKDGLLSAYANGRRLSNVIISSLYKGRIAFYGWQESGESLCLFENGWIWALKNE
jgi:hypothetical protein